MTDPRTCITSNEGLHEAKRLVEKYRVGAEPKGTTKEQIQHAMKLYTSAFHPDSGELQNFAGRMSFQVSLFLKFDAVFAIDVVVKQTGRMIT